TKKHRRSIWPIIIVGLLCAHVGGMVWAVVLINHRTKDLGVVDNYYDAAVHWDQHQKLVRESEKLGWQIKIEPVRDGVNFILTDAAGKPIEGAALEVTAIQPAHPDAPVTFTLAPRQSHYSQPLKYEGFYDFSIKATAGEKIFVTKVTQWVGGQG